MPASTRRAIVAVGLVSYILVYLIVAVEVSLLLPDSVWIDVIYFLVAGLVWIAPLKPVLAWMNAAPADPDEAR